MYLVSSIPTHQTPVRSPPYLYPNSSRSPRNASIPQSQRQRRTERVESPAQASAHNPLISPSSRTTPPITVSNPISPLSASRPVPRSPLSPSSPQSPPTSTPPRQHIPAKSETSALIPKSIASPTNQNPDAAPSLHGLGYASPPSLVQTIERLDLLIQTIASVLRAYSALPHRSPIYLSALRQFYQRAMELYPREDETDDDQEGYATDMLGVQYRAGYHQNSPQNQRRYCDRDIESPAVGENREDYPQSGVAAPSRVSDKSPLWRAVDIDLDLGRPDAESDAVKQERGAQKTREHQQSLPPSVPPPSPDKQSIQAGLQALSLSSPPTNQYHGFVHPPHPDPIAVERLEKEWWGSTVAAAWYGPRPDRSRSNKPRLSGAPSGGSVPKKEAGSPSLGATQRHRRREAGGTRARHNREERDCREGREREREGVLKRDASFVGLHDE